MKLRSYYRLCTILLLWMAAVLVTGCHKDFLDKKPNTTLVVPTTLADFQSLLDNTTVIGMTPVLGEMSADNFYLVYSFWQSLDVKEYNAYIWASDVYGGQGQVGDWDLPYQQVFYANVILEGLPNVKTDSTNTIQWNTIKGAALFTRAYAFYNLAQVFAKPYDGASAGSDPGIPLRLTADVNAASTRSTVQQTYAQILSDLWQAVGLLPSTIPFTNLNRPSRPAAQALLARLYLGMGNYDSAWVYANSCLQSYSALIDYNTLDTTLRVPVPRLNAETFYQSTILNNSQALEGTFYPQCLIDSGLYQSYAANDLRRNIFYRVTSFGPSLKGSYNGTNYLFSGLATDEMYLVRAECAARAGQTTAEINDLDTLLTHRYRKGPFVPFSVASAAEAQDTVLVERRKELAFRGLRWADLRRLNKDATRAITLTRNLNGTIYSLPPNSNFYILPIPPDVLAFNTGMINNPR
jgi:hypothetical protein